MSAFRITIDVEEDNLNPVPWTAEILESVIRDLLKVSTLPGMNLIATNTDVRKRRV